MDHKLFFFGMHAEKHKVQTTGNVHASSAVKRGAESSSPLSSFDVPLGDCWAPIGQARPVSNDTTRCDNGPEEFQRTQHRLK